MKFCTLWSAFTLSAAFCVRRFLLSSKCFIAAATVLLVVVSSGSSPVLAQNPTGTATALTVTSGGVGVPTVPAKSVVTLTATVTAGGAPVSPGTVNFCDATAISCTDIHLIGTAQLTNAGTAVVRFVPGIGSHSYKAVFTGTNCSSGPTCTHGAYSFAKSASSVAALSVTGASPTTTTLQQTGTDPTGATLTVTVSSPMAGSIGGTVSFLDNENSNANLGIGLWAAPSSASFPNTSVASQVLTGSTIIGDFNGDGNPDIVVAGQTEIQCLLGNGDGTYRALPPMNLGAPIVAIAAADLNSDGKLDLIAIQASSGALPLLGLGDGTFTTITPTQIAAVVAGNQQIAVADFNGDGIADVALLIPNRGLAILLGNGDGTLQSPVQTPFYVDQQTFLVAGDINGDGYTDLMLGSSTASGVEELLNNGDGTFQFGGVIGGEQSYRSFTLGDVNNDGNLDLVLVGTGQSLFVLPGNGDGTFQSGQRWQLSNSFTSLALGDFNGDGIADVFLSAQQLGAGTEFQGVGDGTFSPAATVTQDVPGGTPLTANLDGNGRSDILLVNTNGIGEMQELLTQTSRVSSLSGVKNYDLPAPIVASYSGDSQFSPSISQPLSLPSSGFQTTVSLVANPASSLNSQTIFGQQVVLTATVSPYVGPYFSLDGETIQFTNDGTTIGQASLSGGVATLNITSLPVGLNGLSAVLNGGTYTNAQAQRFSVAPSSSNSLQYPVAPIPTTISLQVENHVYGDPQFPVPITSNSPAPFNILQASGPVLFNVQGPPTQPIVQLTPTGVGQVTITASQPAMNGYAAATQTATFNITLPPTSYVFPAISAGTPETQSVAFYFPNGTASAVSSIAAVTQGIPNLDFTLAPDAGPNTCSLQTYPPGSACSLNVTFTPQRAGVRQGAVVLNDTNGNALATVYLSGIGNGGLITFPTNSPTVTTLASLESPYGIVIDVSNNIYVASNPTLIGGPISITEYMANGATKTLGSGLLQPAGICLDGAGNVYVGGLYSIYKITPAGSQSILTTLSGSTDNLGQNQSHYCAIDSKGNLYVTSPDDTGVVVLNLATGQISPLNMNGFGGSDTFPLGLAGIAIDSSDNIYVADEYNARILKIPAGGGGPAVIQDGHTAYVTGLALNPAGDLFISTAFGQIVEYQGGNLPGIQLDRQSNFPQIAFDTFGNLYRTNMGNAGYYGAQGSIEEMHLADMPAMQFGTVNIGGSGSTQTVIVGNSGNVPLTFSSVTPSTGFLLDGASTCYTGASIVPDATCALAVDFQPTSAVSGGTLTLTDNAPNLPNPQVLTLLGNTPQIAPTISVTASPSASIGYSTPASIFVSIGGANGPATGSISFTVNGGGSQGPLQMSGGSAVIGLGTLNAGSYSVAVTYSGDGSYTAGSTTSATVTVNPALLNVVAPTVSMVAGAPVPPLTPSYTGFVNGDSTTALSSGASCSTTATSGSATGSYPITCSGAGAANYTFTYAAGALTVTKGTAQKITFSGLGDVTYGVAPIALNGTATSGLPVTYAVLQGNAVLTPVSSGFALTILGAGPVTVEARQSGNTTYAPAEPVDRTFNVAPHPLNVAATNLKRAAGQENPLLTYSFQGFVNADTASVISGAPVLSTTAVANSPAGTYNITIAAGTLASNSYEFELKPGILTVTSAKTGTAQKIAFANIANKTYGAAPITLAATASSGLTVSYSVISGPATLVNNVLRITGVGTVLVEADQAGNTSWEAADPVQRTFVVSPKILKVTADSARRPYAQPNPVFSYGMTGFVNGETAAVISGAPTLSTTATSSSDVGTYTIAITAGTLSSANYTFDLEPGTLTITIVSQTLNYPALGTVNYGSAPIVLGATASSGLGVTYQVIGTPVGAMLNGSTINITGQGSITIEADQAGNIDYQPVSVRRTLTIKAAPLMVSADNQNKQQGDANPTLTWSVNGFVNGDQPSILTGTPVLSTTAKTQSPVGSYPIKITAGTLIAPLNYVLQMVNGTLTITSNISF